MKKLIMTMALALTANAATIYDTASNWNAATSRHAVSQLNNSNTGPFILAGNGYSFGVHNVNIGFLSNSDYLTVQLANGDRIQGILLGGSDAPLGTQICADADGLHVGCWPSGATWTGAWGFVLDNPASVVKLYSVGRVTWSMDYLKAAVTPVGGGPGSEVPEPNTMAMVGLGIVTIAVMSKRR